MEEEIIPYVHKGFILRCCGLVDEFCKSHGFKCVICEKAKAIVQKFYTESSASRKPSAVAAASVYLACQEEKVKISQVELAVTAKTSDKSLRNACKEIEKIL